MKDPYRLTVPTILTLMRFVLVPGVFYAICIHAWFAAGLLFFIAACTDILDGALARLLDETTLLGAYLDPLADKLLINACYVAFIVSDTPLFKLPAWFVWGVFIKEALLLFGAWYVVVVHHKIDIKPTVWGKAAMAAQSLFVGWLMVCLMVQWAPLKTFSFIMWSVFCLIMIAFFEYARSALRGIVWCLSRDGLL